MQVLRHDPETGRPKWWIAADGELPECGPYDTRNEARRDERGMRRFLARLDAGRNPFA